MSRNIVVALALSFLFSAFSVSAAENLITKNLSLGLKNDAEVRILQKFLVEKGFLQSEVTGTFGAKTFAAVKLFQKKNSIVQTGTVGPKTRFAINTSLQSQNSGMSAQNTTLLPQVLPSNPPPQTFYNPQSVVPPTSPAATPNPPTVLHIEPPVIVSHTFVNSYLPKFQGVYITGSVNSDVWLEYSYNGVTTVTPKIHNTQSGSVPFTISLGDHSSVVYSGKIFVSNEAGVVTTSQFAFQPSSTTGPLTFVKTMPTQLSDVLTEATRYYAQFHTYDSFCPVAIYEVLATHLTEYVPTCGTTPTDWHLSVTKLDGTVVCLSKLGVRNSSVDAAGSWYCSEI